MPKTPLSKPRKVAVNGTARKKTSPRRPVWPSREPLWSVRLHGALLLELREIQSTILDMRDEIAVVTQRNLAWRGVSEFVTRTAVVRPVVKPPSKDDAEESQVCEMRLETESPKWTRKEADDALARYRAAADARCSAALSAAAMSAVDFTQPPSKPRHWYRDPVAVVLLAVTVFALLYAVILFTSQWVPVFRFLPHMG